MSNPFGNYDRMTMGDILNSLVSYGIPITKVSNLSIGSEDRIMEGNGPFARYKYFDGIEQPLFHFKDATYTNLQNEKGYQLTLGNHMNPALVVSGPEATPKIYDVLCRGLTNFITDPFYALHKDAGAFFQGGYGTKDGKWFYIEFWKPAGAQAWLDAINLEIKKNQ